MCVVQYFIGIPCPGCGLLHALWEAVHLHWGEAFHFFPLWPLVLIFFLVPWRREKWAGQFFLGALLIQWVIRLTT